MSLFDGKGHAARATVSRLDNDTVELALGDSLPANESPLELTLAVAVPKGDTMSLIVQKLTELGVVTIQPLVSEHSEVPADVIEKRLDRWRRVALEAAKQCGRCRLPTIEPSRPFDQVARKGAAILSPGAPPPSSPPPIVLVGPEGGWSSEELELAHERDVPVFGLGPRTMRTETATIAVASVLQWIGGDLG